MGLLSFSLTPNLDIDECVSGINDCLSDVASCKNTEGSYECACNHGYVGDGKTSCILVPGNLYWGTYEKETNTKLINLKVP